MLEKRFSTLKSEYTHTFFQDSKPPEIELIAEEESREEGKSNDEVSRLTDLQKQMYEMMFEVDYDPNSNFKCQTTFTYLDWRIAENIVKIPTFNFGDVYQN